MSKDFKQVIKNKRLEAGKLMTEKQIAQCNTVIHAAAVAAAISGWIPIPVADAIPISAAQVTMVTSLGKIFGQKVTSAAAKGAIAAAAATFVGRNLVKFIPIAGWIVSAGVAASITEAIGWTIAVDMAKSYRQEYERKKNASAAAEAWAEVEAYKLDQGNDCDEDADDFGTT